MNARVAEELALFMRCSPSSVTKRDEAVKIKADLRVNGHHNAEIDMGLINMYPKE